jgi:2-polyprenyl-3-methyl-5-hydroxy-6-metoxy-1,4-benzoquinol methylase
MSQQPAITAVQSADEVFEKLYPQLEAGWGADPDMYQGDNVRARNVIDHLQFLEGCRVLDIGCNFGLYSLLLAPLAASVHGIDISTKCISKADAAKQHFRTHVYDTSNVTFEKAGMYNIDHATAEYDAVLACNVLYHLSDSEIGTLKTILESCRKVFFQMRPRRKMAFEKNKETFHYISRNSVCGGMYTVGHAIDFLQPLGFRDFTICGEENYWCDEPFPVILAERE